MPSTLAVNFCMPCSSCSSKIAVSVIEREFTSSSFALSSHLVDMIDKFLFDFCLTAALYRKVHGSVHAHSALMPLDLLLVFRLAAALYRTVHGSRACAFNLNRLDLLR
eukprot:gnl/MRDRNA2_/MRDRNA2_231661_c0_seq1.p1 gnl/MRDRNA2_/MRDRNA2_231661_c0~~gnl/MRDRNA2_/MRDRNA2_231661_c0_seq1.p1  ORF type:complete len:108 (+),score=7.02 gnl/MRDRNA2_/MRDRNA2_231661_c0_seq1:92-415(+)